MKADRVKIVLGFIVISLIWGSTWLAIKVGLETIPPFSGVALRFTIALFFFFIIMKTRGIRPPFDRDAIRVYVTMGTLSFSIPFGLIYWAEQYVPTGLASVLFAVYPLIIAILSQVLLSGERLNSFKVIGIASGFLGVAVIFWQDLAGGSVSGPGMAAILVSTLLQALSLIITKKFGKHVSPVALSFCGIAFGLPIMCLMAGVLEGFSGIHFTLKGLASLAYLGTFGTVVTFTIYYWLLKRIEVVYLSLMSFVTPVIAVILGTFWLGESLSSEVFLGASLVLLGLFIANSRDLRETIRRTRLRGGAIAREESGTGPPLPEAYRQKGRAQE